MAETNPVKALSRFQVKQAVLEGNTTVARSMALLASFRHTSPKTRTSETAKALEHRVHYLTYLLTEGINGRVRRNHGTLCPNIITHQIELIRDLGQTLISDCESEHTSAAAASTLQAAAST